jgi:tartrate-resistant acid phosphatase type 5
MKLFFISFLSSFIHFSFSNDTPLISLISIGDWGGYNLGSTHKTNILNVANQINNDINNYNYDGIISTGDNFYYCGIQNLEDENIQNDFTNLFGKFNIPWYNSLGNHDYGYNISAQLLLHNIIPNWILPNNYYYKVISKNNINLHLIVLDTNPCVQKYINNDQTKWDPCGSLFPTCKPYNNNLPCQFHNNILKQSCSNQFNWFQNLINSINKNTNDYIIVLGHHPINEIDVKPFINIINTDIIDLYINGHVHIMGSYNVNGFNKYFTNGAASMVSEFSTIDNNNYTWYSKTTGYMRHYFFNDYILNQFISSNGIIIKEYKLYKNINTNIINDASSCTDANAIASNIIVTMKPSNPTIGSNYELDTTYTLSETITGGTANYYVSLSGFPVINQKNDLCKDLSNGPTPCPLNKGTINSKITGTVPSNSPHGSYSSKIIWTNTNNQQILCLQFNFNL